MSEDKNPKEASNIFHSIMKASVSKPTTSKITYTEAELLKAIKYACEYQKATDYQTAGRLLIVDDSELKANSILLLDELASDTNAASEIKVKDIFE
jgi:hypothetical protein